MSVLQVHGFSHVPLKIHTLVFDKTHPKPLLLLGFQFIQQALNIEELARLAAVAKDHGIPLASHDDDSIGKLDLMRNWNVAISEFPVELGVAIEAKQRGLAVVMGAPNVVLGKSHSNNVSAFEAISYGAVDILCSDYYPPSMLQAVFFSTEAAYLWSMP
ncbi:hypothetical protein [Alicyclobacillus fastidiosus]|uniref:hypothetical protein n=1 Tax=Alicyclobacillus fastidiosus TaxID=392011 RepID=UPI0023E990F8|nr:hypothetical protein [Alicyclobacillus fastidiosus]GMA60432.1 hypothetical protein GCM10025859_08720 [Alicyclobacillus fastidiosus]